MYAGFSTGYTSMADGSITTTKGPFHAHELVHLAFSTKNNTRNYLVEEGCAYYLGSRLYNAKSYQENMRKLCQDIVNKDTVYSIANLINQSPKIPWNGYSYKYPFGALLCQMVYQKQGAAGLRELMFTDTYKTEELTQTLMNILGFNKKQQLFKAIKQAAVNELAKNY